MNNREFISALASKMGMNVGDTQKMMNDTIDEMVNQFDEGNELFFHGFGTFEVHERAARTGRNPQTGAEMIIPACKVPSFKAGKALKAAVNA